MAKSFIKNLCQFGLVLGLILASVHLTALAGNLPATSSELFSKSGLPTPAEGDSGQETLSKLVFSALGYVKVLIAVIGILILTVIGYQLVINGANEEEVTKGKRALTYTILAFVMISMSDDIGKIFDMKDGTILQSPQEILQRVRLFDRQVEIGITFMKYVIGAFATLMLVRAGTTMITSGGDEEAQGKAKQNLMYTSGALLMIFVGDIFINKVFYKINKNVYSGITGVHPQLDAKAGVEQIVGITNLIVTFVGPVAVLILLAGAIMYATAAGEEERMEKAKRLVFSAAVGIIAIYGAFALVSTVIAGKLSEIGAS